MLKKELLKLIEALREDDDIDEVLSKSDVVKALANSGLTLESFKTKLASDESFKSFIDSEKDKHHNKALETWKTNNLQKLLDDEIKKRYPDKDPKDTELDKLKADIEKMQKEAIKKDLTNKAIKIATEKKLPVELVDFIIGEDETATTKNLETLTTIFSTHDEAIKTELLKNNSYTPPGGSNGDKPGAFGLKLAQQNAVKDTNSEDAKASYFK